MSSESKMPDEIWLSDDGNWRFARHSGNITNEGEYNGAVKYIRADLSALEAERGDVVDGMNNLAIRYAKAELLGGMKDAEKVYGIETCVHDSSWNAMKKAFDFLSGASQPRPPAVAGCEQCHGVGEYLAHSDDCRDDLCALNGDIHSCNGKVIDCHCTPPANPDLAAVRDALEEYRKDWRTRAGSVEPIDQALAILDRKMKGE